MKKIKKIGALFLAMTLGLTACGAQPTTSTSETTAAGTEAPATDTATESATLKESTNPEALETAETENNDASTSDGKVYQIGVVQFAKHPALDEAREGFVEELDALGVSYELDYQDAQSDQSNLKVIAQRFVNNNCDLILAIGTPAVQAVSEETKTIPILGTAVTDYVETNLVSSNEVPGGNVSGTSDWNPINEQIELLLQLAPEAKTIGIIYTTSEANSKIQVDAAKKELERLGIKVEESAITSGNDLQQAAQTLARKVDGIFVPTDNVIASSIQVLAEVADSAKIPVVGGEENQVKGGATATIGLSYRELGKQTADMAKEILVDGADVSTMPIETSKTFNYVYNQASIDAIGVEIPEVLKSGTAY